MCRKFEKMDMINSMGIFQTKELDYADIYLECINILKPFASIKGVLTPQKIRNQLKILFRKYIIPTTILGDKIMSERVEGTLSFWTDYFQQKAVLGQIYESFTNGKIDQTKYNEQVNLLASNINRLRLAAEEQENELILLSSLKKKFYDE